MKTLVGLCALITAAYFPTEISAKDKHIDPPNRVYENIPASWNYYFIEPELVEKYTGAEKKEVCFHEDFKEPSKFKSTPIRTNIGQRRRLQDFKLMLGEVDFIVLAKDTLVVKTEHTGAHVLNLKYCKRELPRAKYLKFLDEIEANPSDHCYSSVLKDSLSFFTRRYSGFAGCKIASIHEWTGPFELDTLKAENDTLK